MVSLVPKPTTHYHTEDIPDDSLDTLIDLRDSAQTSMEQLHERSVRLVEHTGPIITDAQMIASDIRKWGKRMKNGNLVSAAEFIRTALDTAWEALRETHKVVEAAGALQSNNDAVIATQLKQIEESAYELETILNAITEGDTGNYRFEPLMRLAREEITEDAETIGYENAEDELYNDVWNFIRMKTDVDNYAVVSRLIALISGNLSGAGAVLKNKPSKAEIAAFKNLVAVINKTLEVRSDAETR